MMAPEEQARADFYGLLARLFYAPADATLLKGISEAHLEGELARPWEELKRAAASADPETFTKEISAIPFFRNKTKSIIGAAKKVAAVPSAGGFGGKVPRTGKELQTLPGVAYKTAHVIQGELFDEWDGIPTDTHVRRFALRSIQLRTARAVEPSDRVPSASCMTTKAASPPTALTFGTHRHAIEETVRCPISVTPQEDVSPMRHEP
jgi:hypothetical protein